MAENFETLENILPDLANKEIEITLVEAVYKFQKEEEEKTRFHVENDLQKILEQSQSLTTKRNTKWVVKLFQGNKQFFCFAFKKHKKQKFKEIDLLDKLSTIQSQNNCLHRLVSSEKHHNTSP